MTLPDLPHSDARAAAPSRGRFEGVLVVVSDSSQRAALVDAIRRAGVSVVGVGRVAEVEHWPRGQLVIADADHVMPLWLTEGAIDVIVLARNAEEWSAALGRGATGWLQLPVSSAALAVLASGHGAFVAGAV